METYVCLLFVFVLITEGICASYIGDKKTYSSYTYRGRFKGKCSSDGLYYRDEKSFVYCSNGNSYVQPCSPGTHNSGYTKYEEGHSYQYRDFCDVNLVDEGYGSSYHKYSPSGSVYQYGRNVEHRPSPRGSKYGLYGDDDAESYTRTAKTEYGLDTHAGYGHKTDTHKGYGHRKVSHTGYGLASDKLTGYGHNKDIHKNYGHKIDTHAGYGHTKDAHAGYEHDTEAHTGYGHTKNTHTAYGHKTDAQSGYGHSRDKFKDVRGDYEEDRKSNYYNRQFERNTNSYNRYTNSRYDGSYNTGSYNRPYGYSHYSGFSIY